MEVARRKIFPVTRIPLLSRLSPFSIISLVPRVSLFPRIPLFPLITLISAGFPRFLRLRWCRHCHYSPRHTKLLEMLRKPVGELRLVAGANHCNQSAKSPTNRSNQHLIRNATYSHTAPYSHPAASSHSQSSSIQISGD